MQVRIVYGEGDRFGCWLDVVADSIVWHAVGAPDAGATLPQSRSSLPTRMPPTAAAEAPAGAADSDRPGPSWESDLWLERGIRLPQAGRQAPGSGSREPGSVSGNVLVKDRAGGVRASAHGRGVSSRHAKRRERDVRRGRAATQQ